MILTMAWKEFREHWPIWLTMVLATALLGPVLGKIASPNDQAGAAYLSHLAILGLAATYGVVCGAMMLAGETESGTLVFLDVFLGRRGLLWWTKLLLGLLFVAAQSLVVAGLLFALKQAPPEWGTAILGQGRDSLVAMRAQRVNVPGPIYWFALLPVVTLEGFAWGLFGSAFSRRVLPAAAVAAAPGTVFWLIAIMTPPTASLVIRILACVTVLTLSCTTFMSNLGDKSYGAPPPPRAVEDGRDRRRRRKLDSWDDLDQAERERGWGWEAEWGRAAAAPVVVAEPLPAAILVEDDDEKATPPRPKPPPLPSAPPPRIRRDEVEAARSPTQALWWLTWQQAGAVLAILAGACIFVGFFLPTGGQLLWPMATLVIGVACGAAAFGPEQRDLSYEFLAAQHFPLRRIWAFKIIFWFVAAWLLAFMLVLGGVLAWGFFEVAQRPRGQGPQRLAGLHFGMLRELLGPVLYFGGWLVYGFCAGQIFVWLCRKLMLALFLSALVGAAALVLWFPSLLCGGTLGWQAWLAPILALAATRRLIRAWAGGAIKERKPMAVLTGVALLALVWAGLNYAYRAWELPAVESPLDRAAFRVSIPSGKDNDAGRKLLEAMPEGVAGMRLDKLEEACRLPLGVIEAPPADGQAPLLSYLPGCKRMVVELRDLARHKQVQRNHAAAFEHLAQALTVSRTLRNKAPLQSYLAGLEAEAHSLEGLETWLTDHTPTAASLRRVLDELNRHRAETPPPLECIKAECYRSGGNLANPNAWTFAAAPGTPGRIPGTWLSGAVAFSLEMPWEFERATRLWQLVWAGHFRGIETPYWDLSPAADVPRVRKEVTGRILKGWLPAKDDPSGMQRLANWLDASWLADDRLFFNIVPLRAAATRARWSVDSARLRVALGLYNLEEGKAAARLGDLVPKYLPEAPVDPYSGRAFGYRTSAGERVDNIGDVPLGQGIVWSTGPDRADDGGRRHSDRGEEDSQWQRPGNDVIALVPVWR